ncbi:MAG TPA: ATP-dependent DNA helicase RecG [Kofleriaceae bacterium]|nr:ATP-dependent DNA helicase RecG [Kofleriaceae bacterium]
MAQPSYSFRRQVEGLREPLLVAARDGFEGIDEMPALGEALRGACDRLVAQPSSADVAELIEWRRRLDGFDRLDGVSKAAQVARGLRLCHALVGRMPAAPAVRSGKAQLLASSVETLPGIGPALAEKLTERGIESVEDLLWLVPRRYDDVRKVAPLAEAIAATPGERVTTAGLVESCRFARRGRVRWVDVRFGPDRGDDRARLAVRFFNAHASMVKRFPVGARVVLSGALQSRGSGAEMANPDVLAVTTPDGVTRNTGGLIIPRYADIIGVPAATLRKACAAAVERHAGQLPDAVPAAVAARLGLAPLAEAIRSLHQPPESLSIEEVEALNRGEGEWHRRLAFDELFVLGLAVARRRAEHRADRAVACEASVGHEVGAALPFALTAAQQRAIETIAADLGRQVPMNRLLQGDVGSGKTAVAFAAALQAIRAGRQVAVMAPTEILAEQHFATLSAWAGAVGVECALLTAATPRGVRASTLSLLAAGRLALVVGTHSLLADSVSFAGLGLAVIDEQHRFGVAQRFRLRGKGDGQGVPHLLVMTATPIPRTLALTAYGDLDVTVIDELPPGREPPTTTIVSGSRARERMYERVKARVAEPGSPARAFVVCPLVEPSEDDEARVDWADATSLAAELGGRLAPARVGLVHGRMASAERDDVMARFRSGALDVLVATTVIEVGVDVPEAILMVIEDADRFGLAQLHQLRGRIGRGGGESHCVLLTRGRSTADGTRRLEVMAATCDGFRIAEEDLQLRGPGELLGVRQAGLPRLRFGDLRAHADLLLLARSEADALLADDPELARPEHAITRAVLEARGGTEAAYGADSG